jgi:hypothetical protein
MIFTTRAASSKTPANSLALLAHVLCWFNLVRAMAHGESIRPVRCERKSSSLMYSLKQSVRTPSKKLVKTPLHLLNKQLAGL